MPYKLSEVAKNDLSRIYRRGVTEFGETRADLYFSQFIERFELIAEEPHLYPVAHEIDLNIRKTTCGVDVIYYELSNHGITILRILGRQDHGAHF